MSNYESQGSRRRQRQRSRRRYKVRYDRIVAVVLVLIVLVVIISSCMKGCSNKKDGSAGDDNAKTKASDTTNPTIVDNLDTSGASPVITGSPEAAVTTQAEYVTESHDHSEIFSGDLVLVNALHEYKFPVYDVDLVTLHDNILSEYYGVADNVIKLDRDALTQLNSLMQNFYLAQSNNDIWIIGGYRTLEEQEDKYNTGQSAFRGGCTDYHTARSFDMGVFPKDASSGYYSPTGVYSWIDEHAAEYGFVVRFPEGKEAITGEPARTQTYRYVGIPHAVYMRQNGLCLEEYIELLRSYNINAPLEITSGSTVYYVYFVPAGEGSTDVPVPSNKSYTLSGNNVDGFIVTVTMN
ncbi:MAG: M15 family metallopeptidase [Ruminococcus sp.]|nr:M15 family metallopeptidase [Ruminococcus sp.]